MLDFLKGRNDPKKAKVGIFIPPPEVKIPYNTTDTIMRDAYRYTPHDAIDVGVIERGGITTANMAFHKFMAGIANNFISQLYAVPAARKYYGDDFLHGVRCITIAQSPPRCCIRNLDNTTEATLFTKEIVKYCAIVLDQWLQKYEYYLRWEGPLFYAVKGPIDYRFQVDHEYRIFWY